MELKQTGVAGTMESGDIMITLEPGKAGIEIDLQSMVEKQYGRQIRQVIADCLADLHVKQAKVTAVDKGALDCTIHARVKTAVYRAAGNTDYEWKV
ncbi:citrate lyase acyl carrier protein [Spirochaetia bacterium]|nr:citrate lyase acyl carrier protein [Spirochaetia bacterium]